MFLIMLSTNFILVLSSTATKCQLLDTGFVTAASECPNYCALIKFTIKPYNRSNDCSASSICIENLLFCIYPDLFNSNNYQNLNRITDLLLSFSREKFDNLRTNSILAISGSNEFQYTYQSEESREKSVDVLSKYQYPFDFFFVEKVTDNQSVAGPSTINATYDCLTYYYTDCDLLRCMEVELQMEGSSSRFCAYKDASKTITQNCLTYRNMYTELVFKFGDNYFLTSVTNDGSNKFESYLSGNDLHNILLSNYSYDISCSQWVDGDADGQKDVDANGAAIIDQSDCQETVDCTVDTTNEICLFDYCKVLDANGDWVVNQYNVCCKQNKFIEPDQATLPFLVQN